MNRGRKESDKWIQGVINPKTTAILRKALNVKEGDDISESNKKK